MIRWQAIRRFATKRGVPPAELPRMAYLDELNAIAAHSALLNQTTAPQLLNLEDVRPMMRLYESLPSQEIVNSVVQKVIVSLKQTAKDAAFVFRSLPQDEKLVYEETVRRALCEFLDRMALDVINGKIENNAATAQLFLAYETVDPGAGVVFYENLPQRDLWGGAVIPSLLKVNAAFDDIRQVFERHAKALGGLEFMKPPSVANMVLACVRHNQIETATALFDGLMETDGVSDAVRGYLIDIFIGDAPPALGLSTFLRHPQHVPHRSAMTRLLEGLWRANKDVDEQVSIFADYLSRLTLPNELSIKPVTLVVVHNVVSAQASPEEAVKHIVSLCQTYGNLLERHEVLLNIILTEVSQKWQNMDEARDLILGIVDNYETENSSASFRVRLNALENISGAANLTQRLWESRKRGDPIQKWDWFALIRATRNGAYFKSEWVEAGQPFKQDVARFAVSRRYNSPM